MFVKCETRSKRVKCICFHPKLTWFLASLHNGTILLWDYSTGSLIERFTDHEAPVRAVNFHRTQPLFVSGADDYSIKIWNYTLRKCLFTLLGHVDYIRSVQFHHKYPWILSASDDQTVRIWNWQNRSCLAILPGHNHYVMYAQFHPNQDLIASTSLDQTIRIWDISGLVKKHTGAQLDVSLASFIAASPDILTPSDAVCKFIIDAHERGINYVCFHPTLPLIASAADDRLIKLWRYNEVKWWEVDTFRGHFDNVSCVIFHPLREVLISNSEDKTIRVWDINKRTLIHTYKREGDRFWILSALENSNIIGAGHDSGSLIFKLSRERPAFDKGLRTIYYVSDWNIKMYDEGSGQTYSLTSCRKSSNPLCANPYSLQYNVHNSFSTEFLIGYEESIGMLFDFCSIPHDESQELLPAKATTKQIVGSSAVFISYNRFALLNAPKGNLLIYNTNCVLNRKIELPVSTNKIFPAGLNRILLETEDYIYLFNVQQREIVSKLHVSEKVRHVVWCPNFNNLALLSKHYIVLTDTSLHPFCIVHEPIRIKSGAWSSKAFIYSILSHIKYCLLDGDQGVIKSVPKPVYIMKVLPKSLYVYDTRINSCTEIPIDTSEFKLKIAIEEQNYQEVASIISKSNLQGNAIINYLREKKHPEVAMYLVKDPVIRFNLFIECGEVQKALEIALDIPDKVSWDYLAIQAARQGDFQVVETVYQRTKNIDDLAFLYLLSGQMSNLQKLLHFEQSRKDFQSSFLNALFLGDVRERVRILAESGQHSLALLTARTHNITDMVKTLEASWEGPPINVQIGEPLTPAKPVYVHSTLNWNKSEKTVSEFINSLRNIKMPKIPIVQETEEYMENELEVLNASLLSSDDVWEQLDDVSVIEDNKELEISFHDITDDEDDEHIQPGESVQLLWSKEDTCPAKLLAAGCYKECLQFLSKNMGLENAEPLLPILKKFLFSMTTQFPLMPFFKSKTVPLFEDGSLQSPGNPKKLITIAKITEWMKNGHKFLSEGKISQAQKEYTAVIHNIPFIHEFSVNDDSSQDLHNLMATTSLYCLAARIELERAGLQEHQIQRNVELAAYLGSLKLKPAHRYFFYRRAMAVAWKANNFLTAATFAQQLITEYNTPKLADVIANAKKILNIAEKHKSDAYSIDFDHSNIKNTTVCSTSLTRILESESKATCPFCKSKSKGIYSDTICSICWVSGLKTNTKTY